ncbi:hypothetical protein [Nitrospirillum amazonense]|uniref:hypothetical protein n=1 Tax=Nitrospirillum amazonense TaxID=28077 RepID=UPI002412DFC4|nr:hypothetical protein [Nitrospirillum amazonense]MDG3443703.1 hypothetical protein [Nitrospirillum amazonense]
MLGRTRHEVVGFNADHRIFLGYDGYLGSYWYIVLSAQLLQRQAEGLDLLMMPSIALPANNAAFPGFLKAITAPGQEPNVDVVVTGRPPWHDPAPEIVAWSTTDLDRPITGLEDLVELLSAYAVIPDDLIQQMVQEKQMADAAVSAEAQADSMK